VLLSPVLAVPLKWCDVAVGLGELVSECLVFHAQLVDDGGVGLDDLFEAVAVSAQPVAFGFEVVVGLEGLAERSRSVLRGGGEVLEVVAQVGVSLCDDPVFGSGFDGQLNDGEVAGIRTAFAQLNSG
jgi:hypothetical protein